MNGLSLASPLAMTVSEQTKRPASEQEAGAEGAFSPVLLR